VKDLGRIFLDDCQMTGRMLTPRIAGSLTDQPHTQAMNSINIGFYPSETLLPK